MAKKWMQKVTSSMERKGTKGVFTAYCGGKVTQACIEKGKKSSNPTIRKRAVLAETFRKIARKRKK